jgi:hypothetical protein
VGRLVKEPGLAGAILDLLEKSQSPEVCRGAAEAYALAWGIDPELRAACTTRIAAEEARLGLSTFARGIKEASVRPLTSSLRDLISQE